MGSQIPNCTSPQPCLPSQNDGITHSTSRGSSRSRLMVSPQMQAEREGSEGLKQRKILAARIVERMGLSNKKENMPEQKRGRLIQAITNICLNDQVHLTEYLRGTTSPAHIDSFLNAIEQTELDHLDMVLVLLSKLHHKHHFLAPPSHLQAPTHQIVSIREAIQLHLNSPGAPYERFKKIGWDLITQGKVCFFIMAAGKSTRFISQQPKQFTPLNIPSNRSILAILLTRLAALAEKSQQQLTVYLSVNPTQAQALEALLKSLESQCRRLVLYPYTCKTWGALDPEGKVVVEDNGLPSLWPTGTADFLNVLQGDEGLSFPSVRQLMEGDHEYIQFMGCSNVMQKCFDCFSLGMAKALDLDYTTKIVPTVPSEENKGPQMYQTSDNEPYVCDFQEWFPLDRSPGNSHYTFMNSSLFKLDYLKRRLAGQEWEWSLPRKKINRVLKRPASSEYRQVMVFEKDYSDLFRSPQPPPKDYRKDDNVDCGQDTIGCNPNNQTHHRYPKVQNSEAISPIRGKILLCEPHDYAPLITVTDIGPASSQYLALQRSYLRLPESAKSRVEVDPFISLEGENLDQLRQQLLEVEEEEDIFIERPKPRK